MNKMAAERGYKIPVVDLAGETQRQFLVDREPGQYLGHPTTVLLDDNLVAAPPDAAKLDDKRGVPDAVPPDGP
jgi:hypothetical protein